MKSLFFSVLLLVVVGIGVYFVVNKGEQGQVVEESNPVIFTDQEINLEFTYPEGDDGYILKQMGASGEVLGLVDFIVLTKTEDTLKEIPIGGEGPAIISIAVYENTKKEWPAVWVMNNPRLSNYNLKMEEPRETSVDGAKAVNYFADGLYASNNFIVTNGKYVYVFSGQYLDKDSKIFTDFENILSSVKFIPNELDREAF